MTAAGLYGQVTTGSVQGVVSDSSGGVIPGVHLELVSAATNAVHTARTGDSGAYVFHLIPPGRYTLRASFQGFRAAQVNGIDVEIGRNTIIPIVLQPGEVTQSVEVTAALENVDTQTSSIKANVSSRMFSGLPAGSRNPLRFAELVPGVEIQTGALTGGSQLLGADGASANVAGGRRQQNTFYLDGADNSNVRRNSSLQMPNVEAIAEIQVVTNSNSAEFGKQPGGYFNVITKSGTNQFHGSAFYFFREESLNANTWVRNRSGLPRPPNREKMTGGTLGGPVRRDRTFFFGSFQHYRDQNVATSATTRYPTSAMLTGDFSEYGGTLYDPDTRTPVPGNRIPASLLDMEILDGFSSPQVAAGYTREGNLRLASTLTRISGAHNIRAGGDIQRIGFRRLMNYDNSQFRFQGRFTNRGSGSFPSVPNAQFAHSFADFMMGRVNDFTANGIMDYTLPTWGFFGFVQDQWRVSRRFTLNLGLRYEVWKGMQEASGRASAFVEGHRSDQFPTAPLHLAFQGDRGIPAGFIAQDRNNLAPRLGVSWDVFGDGKLAIRAGGGVYYAFPAAQMRLFSTEEFPQRPVIQGFTARLYDPWITSQSPRFSSPPTPFPQNTLDWIREARFNPPYARVIGYNPQFTTPKSYQWNVFAERQFSSGATVSVAYVANRGRNLLRGFPFNFARFRNLPDGTPPSLDANNIIARQPFSDYSRFSIRMDTDSVSDDDSLQTWANFRTGSLITRVIYAYVSHFGDGGGILSTPFILLGHKRNIFL